MQPARLRLGQLLVDARILSAEQLEQALVLQKADGRRLGTLLVENGFVSETQLTQVLSQQLSVPWVSLYHIDFSRELLNLVPPKLAEKYCLVPIYVRPVRGQGDTLYVAMEDPMNEDALKACSDYAGLPVRAMIAAPTDIRKAVQTYYGVTPPVPRRPPAAALPPEATPPQDEASVEEVEPDAVVEAEGSQTEGAEVMAASAAAPQNAAPSEASSVQTPPSSVDADGLADRATPVMAYAAAPEENGIVADAPVVAPFMVDEPGSVQAGLTTIAEKADKPPAADDAPTLEVREVDISKARKRKQVQLTLLDGTTIKLPSVSKKRAVPTRNEPPSPEDNLTAADLLAALRAAAHGVDATDVLGENLRWEKMFAAILSLLLRKHLILERELIEELKKI
jgi:type IV pilus assembly protein PilB